MKTYKFKLSLKNTFKEKNGPCVMVEEKDDINALKRSGVAVIENDIIVDFEEKPDKPKSSFAVPPVYIYPERNLDLFDRYMSEGGNPDARINTVK